MFWIKDRKEVSMQFDLLEMTSKSGRPCTLRVPKTTQSGPSTFIVAAHKSGSTLMNRITKELLERSDIPHINVELDMWRQGIAITDWPLELYDLLERPGFVFDSFRSLQRLPDLTCFAESPKIFLVRDPRDVAVSFYFSMLKSHSAPASGGDTAKNLEIARDMARETSMEDYVLRDNCGRVLRNMLRFCDFKDTPNATFFRYEDIIFSKRDWTATLAQMLGAKLPQNVLHEIADKNDIRPDKEDPSQHIRQVTPGNYRQHLSEGATAHLKDRYAKIFTTFGY